MEKSDLSPEEKILVIIRDELYGGSWDEMIEDLNARLESRPYVFKLAGRIESDIERISRLRSIEEERDIDLADFVEGS
jgi:hypothetical protein